MGVRSMVFVPVAAMLLLLASLTACGRKPERTPEANAGERAGVAVSLQPSKVLPVQRVIRVVGTMHGDDEVTIAAKVPGRIAAIHRDMGDRVSPQDVLLQIDPTDYQLAVQQKELAVSELLAKLGLRQMPEPTFDLRTIPSVRRAALQAQNASDKLERGRKLHQANPPLISDQEFADLQTAHAVSKVDLDVQLQSAQSTIAEAQARQFESKIARQRLSDATVRAATSAQVEPGQGSTPLPSSYAVASRQVSPGAYVKEGDALFRLVADDAVKLRGLVPERFVSVISLGQDAIVSVDAFTQTFTGKVTRINPQIDHASRTFQIEILVPNEKRLLRPGSFARAAINIRLDPQVIFVPQESVVSFAGATRIYVVEDGKAKAIDIETGERRGEYVEVARGELTKGQSVIVGGVTKLAPGVAVNVTNAAEAQAGNPDSNLKPVAAQAPGADS